MTKILYSIAWILLSVAIVLCILTLPQLPDQIPVHFNLKGEPNRTGSKYNLIALPLIFTGIFLLIHFVKKWPGKFNYPVKITPENQAYQYELAVRLLTWIQLLTGALLLLLLLQIRHVTLYNGTGPGSWFIIIVITSYIIPSIIYIGLAFKKR